MKKYPKTTTAEFTKHWNELDAVTKQVRAILWSRN